MTFVITQNQKVNGDTQSVPIQAGRYLFAVGGVFDGATVTFKLNIGPATGVPVAGMAYTAPIAEIVWLPACTAFITVSVQGASTDVSVAMAPVALEVT